MTQRPAHIVRKLLFVAAIPVLVLCDTALALARGWSTGSKVDRAGVWLAVACVLALALLVATPRGRRLLDRFGTKLGLLLASFTLAWTLAEGVVGVCFLSRLYDSLHLYTPGLQRLFRPAPGVMPGIEGESRFTTNEFGLRGPALPAREQAYRILCIGGSTTICAYLDDEETWPSLLMRRLNEDPRSKATWIGNSGFSGYTSVNHLDFVAHSTLVNEMDCVIILVGINDFLRALHGTGGVLTDNPTKEFAPMWRRSLVLELARRRWRRMRESATIWVEDVAGDAYQDRRRRRQAALEVETLPDLTRDLDEYRMRLHAIVAALQGKGLRLVFASQPTIWSTTLSDRARSLLWLGELKSGAFLSPAPLAVGMAMFNERLLGVCRETGTRCIDLSAMNGREEFFYDDCHFNEAGAREVARSIAAQADALR